MSKITMMRYVKKILIILTIPYVLWHLYGDVLEYKNFYTYEEFKELELHGKEIITENRFGSSWTGPKCYFHTTSKELGDIDCVEDLKMKQVNIYNGSPVIYYRGQSDVNKSEMCELDISLENEGKTTGELLCDITHFKSSEADKIPIGRAVNYARKLKEAKE